MITFEVSKTGVLKDVTTYYNIDNTIKIPAVVDGITVKEIDDFPFRQSGIKNVFIPKTVKKLAAKCFYNCWYLETIVFEEGSELEIIEESCFYNCYKLTDFKGTFQKLRYIGAKAFYNCKTLKPLDLSKSLISDINEAVFWGTGMKKIRLPETIKTMGVNAFKHSKIDIDFNDLPNLTVIENNAFAYSGITTADFRTHQSSITIENEAFKNCNKLKTVYLSKSVVLTHPNIFANCKHLKGI